MSSPGWVQVKCELRLLAQFSFNLSGDWELRSREAGGGDRDMFGGEKRSSVAMASSVLTVDQTKPLQDGVKDMLVKHHLFSWDL